MSLPYTMVFALLMTEMLVFIALILPLPHNWRRDTLKFLSQSPLMGQVQHIMKIIFVFVFVLFVDSVNRVVKVEVASEHSHHHQPDHMSQSNVAARRFYAQRNMYLTGFTLFLSLILNRSFFMILDLLQSEEKMETIRIEASVQSKGYERALVSETKLKKEVKELNDIVATHASAKRDLDNLKKQAKQQQEEYVRLADANTEMEKKLQGVELKNLVSKKDI